MIRLLFALVLALLAHDAVAHTMSVSHVELRRDAAGVSLDLDLSIRDLALTFPLDADRDGRVTWGELQVIQPAIEAMVVQRVGVSAGGQPCRLERPELAIRRYDDGAYAAFAYPVRCMDAGDLALDYRLLFDRDPQHRALVTTRDGAETTTGVASPVRTIVGSGTRARHPFLDFLREGVHHILIGYDHLAFLLSLLLPAVLVRSRHAWTPAPHLSGALARVAAIVTAFTLAHSITLSAAALGWVTPVSRWVEAAIAASVLLAALNNVRAVVVDRAWLVAFGFGLVHGFGFAGALSELGLPVGGRVAALLGFNLGVELGQIAVVALVLPVLFLVRGRRWYARFAMPLVSLAIAALAAKWLFERMTG